MRFCLIAAALTLLGVSPGEAQKRPLTHADYDAWKSISGQRISPNGRYVAYGVFPQEGDGEVVIHDLSPGTDLVREAAGARPAPAPPDPEASENAPPAQRSVMIQFSADSQYCVFTVFPPKAATEAARRARKRAEEMPKGGLVIVELATKQITRIGDVKGFQLAADDATWLAYHKEAAPEPARATEAAKPAQLDEDEDQDQQRRGGGAAGGGGARGGAGNQTGSPLVLRHLKDGTERTFADAAEYSLAKNGQSLVFTVASKQTEKNGAFVLTTSGAAEPVAMLAGKGRYSRLTWDDAQRRIAFLSTRDDAESRQPRAKLYVAERATPANPVAAETSGLPAGMAIADRASLDFSRDGSRLYFGIAKAPAPPAAPRSEDPVAAEQKAVYDLWHHADDFIQPMQKSRVAQERNRSYRAVYLVGERKTIALADGAMAEVSLPDEGRFAFGLDDRAYRRMVDYDKRYNDVYTVDTSTGERKRVAKQQAGTMQWSHTGTHAMHFDGQNWSVVSGASGERVNLTRQLAVKFFNEEDDHPDTPPAYGFGGWLRDGKSVLLYDRYDIWHVAIDGTRAVNVTDGMGRAEGIQFRVVRLAGEDPAERGIDASKPLLLRAEKIETRETGFYRDRIDSAQRPEKLILEARSFSAPVKAKTAEILLLTASRFDQYPELMVADPSFKVIKKVSNVGAQMEAFRWGTSELVRFRSLDGQMLKATLYKPADFDPAKKYPMIVYIYERLSQGVHNFVEPRPSHSVNAALYVSNGYLVLHPDIAYRVGYPGESALKCVIPAVDAVVAQGFVDEKSIGIQGHSWGGYQISYMITQTNRFKAASAGAPVANMFSAYNGIRWGPGLPRQFQYERTQSRIGGTPWQYPLRFLENSPIFHADKVVTPLLMLHNDGDDAVPWYQGIEYFLALRRLGKEVYMFNYNGEPHGLRKRANQKDYATRLLDFFDYHLKGAKKQEWMERGRPYLEKEVSPSVESNP